MEKKRVTLADIARADGTHVTTVSLALRNSPKLPSATRERIQALAERMGYAPDPALKALVRYRNGLQNSGFRETLAYITNWTSRWGWKQHPSHALFFEGAKAAAAQIGYQLEHFWLSEPGLTHQRLSSILSARGIRGAILASHSRQMDSPVRLDWSTLSGVKIDFFPKRPALPAVSNHQSDAVRLAFRKARAAGAQRIGLVMHRGWDKTVDRMWSAGFLVEQAELEPAARIPVCYFPSLEPRSAWENETEAQVFIDPETFRSWYATWQPDTIIGHRGFFADAFPACGLVVPGDVQLIDLFLHEPDADTAGIIQNHPQVGAAAVEQLATRLMKNDLGIPANASTTFINGSWNDGVSLAGMPSRNACPPSARDPAKRLIPNVSYR